MSWESTKGDNLKQIYHTSDSDFSVLKKFVEANHFDRFASFSHYYDVHKVLTNGGFYGRLVFEIEKPPFHDHLVYFKDSKHKITCLTYSPYQEASEIEDEVKQWAEEKGMAAEVYDSSKSWYYPNHTCFVVLHLKGTTVLFAE